MENENTPIEQNTPEFLQFLRDLAARAEEQLPPADTPNGIVTRQFLENNWLQAQEDLLNQTEKIELYPEPAQWPRRFRLIVHSNYKRRNEDGTVELVEGPITGEIIYRADLFGNYPEEMPCQMVRIDDQLRYFHPNHDPQSGMVCLGEMPPGPMSLTPYFLPHIYGILTYDNYRSFHPLNVEAARYFALEPNALAGLNTGEPLY